MQVTSQNTKVIFSVLSVLFVVLVGILSSAISNPVLKVLFLICGSSVVILCFCGDLMQSERMRRFFLGITGAVFVIILLWSVVSAGSLSAYGKKLQFFFQEDADDSAAAEIYQEVSGETAEMEREISNVDETISGFLHDLQHFSKGLEEQQFFSSRYDPKEVERIASVIRTKLGEDEEDSSPSFQDVRTNSQTVELFYKMRIVEEQCQYINCIKALESVGVNCKDMSIDEYTLMVWDTESLFAIYSMRQSVLEDALQGVIYEENKHLYYKDFKIKLDEYSDTFDYKNWYKDPQSDSSEYIVEWLDGKIMNFYQKFHMNFQKKVN